MKIIETIVSTVGNKCPRCHTGEVFAEKNPFILSKMFSMHKNCSHCNLLYEREPSFFYGAMYVSYALTSGWFIVWFFLNKYIFNFDTLFFAISMVLSIVILSPLTLRWSRLIWLNFFNKYDSKFKNGKIADEQI